MSYLTSNLAESQTACLPSLYLIYCYTCSNLGIIRYILVQDKIQTNGNIYRSPLLFIVGLENILMEGFWQNVFRYQRYFVTVLLGVVWNAVEPLIPLFKKPVTAVALVGLLVGSLAFVTFTMRAMLGLPVS